MDLNEALDEVVAAAKQPKQFPPGVTPLPVSGDAISLTKITAKRARRESLTPAQETVCRWVWETCAKHYKAWEPFEAGFLFDCNVNHELAMWAKMAHVFSEFLGRHRSLNKRELLGELCRLSAGVSLKTLKGTRAKELMTLWRQGTSN